MNKAELMKILLNLYDLREFVKGEVPIMLVEHRIKKLEEELKETL